MRGLTATLNSLRDRDKGEGGLETVSDRLAVLVYGTSDEFTGAPAYRKLRDELPSLRVTEIEDGGHFYRSEEEGAALDRALLEWIGA